METKDILNEEEEMALYVTLEDEEGGEMEFERLAVIDYKGIKYAILDPLDEEDEGIVILQFEEGEGDEDTYIDVEDETILDGVFAAFREQFKDQFDFED